MHIDVHELMLYNACPQYAWIKKKSESYSQGLNLGLPNTSQMLLPHLLLTTKPPELLGIGAENIAILL